MDDTVQKSNEELPIKMKLWHTIRTSLSIVIVGSDNI